MKEINEKWTTISKINKEFDDLYHKVASHYNLSDSSFWIIYALYENRQGCTQKQICSEWCFSKQTINSAIKDLKKKQYIVLNYENDNRKNKTICLTQKGLEVAKNTVEKVIEVENIAFSKVDKKDFDFVINFFQVQLSSFKKAKFERKAILQACSNGSSEILTNVSTSLVNMLYNMQLMKFAGADGVVAYGIIMYISFIFSGTYIGYSIGSAPIIGYHYGAEKYR